jgi:hypothetical protein
MPKAEEAPVSTFQIPRAQLEAAIELARARTRV